MEQQNNLIIYQSEDGATRIETRLENETVWLTLEQMSELFQKSKSTINEHVLNIFKEGELVEDDVKRKIGISDFSTKPTNYYNLDVILNRTVKAYLELAELQALNRKAMYMQELDYEIRRFLAYGRQ